MEESLSVFEIIHRLPSDVAIESRNQLSCLRLATSPYLVLIDFRLRCSLRLAPQRNV